MGARALLTTPGEANEFRGHAMLGPIKGSLSLAWKKQKALHRLISTRSQGAGRAERPAGSRDLLGEMC